MPGSVWDDAVEARFIFDGAGSLLWGAFGLHVTVFRKWIFIFVRVEMKAEN